MQQTIIDGKKYNLVPVEDEVDEYTELKQAIVDGKTIQFYIDNKWTKWKNPDWDCPVNCYRIKPDESKFKVGDWVVLGNETRIITEDTTEEYLCTYNRLWELWTPVEGEWCVFEVFSGIGKENVYDIRKYSKQYENYKNIAPLEFIETLKS